MRSRFLPTALYSAGLALAGLIAVTTVTAAQSTAPSGLPVPRYVSLKSDRVNIRKGPGRDYGIAWVFRRAGLPVEVLKEFEGWRQIRDSEGATGWVNQIMLSGRRTALVLPWELKQKADAQPKRRPIVVLHASASTRSRTLARLEAGVLTSVSSCDGRWCRVFLDRHVGYVEQKNLWGIYPNEVFK